MHPEVQEYVNYVERRANGGGGLILKTIDLQNLNLTDNQIAPLWNIFVKSLDIAAEVTEINLNGNQLTSPPPLGVFANIMWVFLENNPLTDATKIALTTFATRRWVIVSYDNRVSMNANLTKQIIDEHFRAKLVSTPDEVILYLKRIGAVFLLSRLPIELVRMLSNMLPPPAVNRANVGMSYFLGIFNMPAFRPDQEVNNMSLDNLNDYHSIEHKNSLEKVDHVYNQIYSSSPVRMLSQFHRFIRDNGFNQRDLSQKNSNGYTPLALAIYEERKAVTHGKPLGISLVTPIIKRISINDNGQSDDDNQSDYSEQLVENETVVSSQPVTVPVVHGNDKRKRMVKHTACCAIS